MRQFKVNLKKKSGLAYKTPPINRLSYIFIIIIIILYLRIIIIIYMDLEFEYYFISLE